ncbi:two-component system activity regulator YycH [Bacillus sp. MUM 13]|uniref:YycH family regulatory protein n=1 Tax=Bacillus sp. MUM 13 TaxID=1678001 RepID=UPI0008F5A029|nr:two-component system activity regulator YycH [Bacillus sp. MUM 13]OIK15036.1 hypothetical protein BIV59_01045 [Bacillus sp. MUM 13]
MNIEGAKSIILTLLIMISAFLTWNIWTYQPKYDPISQSGDTYSVDIDKKGIDDVVKPNSVLFHKNGKHYQTFEEADIYNIQKELSGWTLYNFRDISSTVNSLKFKDFVHGNGNTEIIFRDIVPLDLFKKTLDIDEENLPSISFDRIVFRPADSPRREANVYFVSYEKQRVFEAKVNSSYIKKFNQAFYQKAAEYPEYQEHGKRNVLYVSKDPSKMNQYKYSITRINTEKFKDALFSDPKYVVRHESVIQGDEYSDGLRLMLVNKESSMISFVNPAQKSKVFGTSSDLLKKSIDFINNHAGWEDNRYLFDGLNEEEQSVRFRLFVKGYPVFNDIGSINEIWGNADIYRYEHPSFFLEVPLPEDLSITLQSGEEVYQRLRNMRNIDMDAVQDLACGYMMMKDPTDSKLVSLEPKWYYRSGDDWIMVPDEDPGTRRR